MSRYTCLAMAVFIFLPCIFSGCTVKKPQTTIAFCFQNLETEFWIASHKAITAALRAKGIKVIEKNANEDANRQFEQVKDLITQGVDGIILIPQDGQSALTIIGECNRAGVPIVFSTGPRPTTASLHW